jgi:hypothetical protein
MKQVPCSRYPVISSLHAWRYSLEFGPRRSPTCADPFKAAVNVVKYREVDGSALMGLHVAAAHVTDSQLASVDPLAVHRPHVTETGRDPLEGNRKRYPIG